MHPKWLAASMLGLLLCQEITAEDKAVPPDPRATIDKQDLINVCVAARRAIGMLPAADLVFVSMSIQRLEAVAEKIPAPAPPKSIEQKPKE
jgi:hypothetical protein